MKKISSTGNATANIRTNLHKIHRRLSAGYYFAIVEETPCCHSVIRPAGLQYCLIILHLDTRMRDPITFCNPDRRRTSLVVVMVLTSAIIGVWNIIAGNIANPVYATGCNTQRHHLSRYNPDGSRLSATFDHGRYLEYLGNASTRIHQNSPKLGEGSGRNRMGPTFPCPSLE